MPIYRITTQKRSSLNAKFENRYYFNWASAEALGIGIGKLSLLEQAIFGSTVTIYNVHWKQMGAAPFGNVPTNLTGAVPAASPTKSFIVAKVFWAATGSYPYYKNYRVHWQASDMSGINWALTKQAVLDDFVANFAAELGGEMVTRGGVALDDPTVSYQYYNEQEENAYYDKP